jgi:hypothetical protein
MKRDITQYDLAELKKLMLADLEREGKTLAPGEELKVFLNFGGDQESILTDDGALVVSAVVERIPLVLTPLSAEPVNSHSAPVVPEPTQKKKRSKWDGMTAEEKSAESNKLYQAKLDKKAQREAAARAVETATFPQPEEVTIEIATTAVPATQEAMEVVAATRANFLGSIPPVPSY